MENLLFLGVPKFGHITAHNVLKFWTLKTVNFPFGTNGKLMVLGVPILKHFRVLSVNVAGALIMRKRYLNEKTAVSLLVSELWFNIPASN